MKKLIYIAVVMLLSAACTHEEKDLFDKPSDDRVAEMVVKARQTLLDNRHGWIFEYYPTDESYGGFNLIVDFLDEEWVNVTAGEPISGMTVTSHTSHYDVLSEESVMLTFHSYNDVLHYFAEEKAWALKADYEFIFMNTDKENIILKGRKGRRKMGMRPLPEDITAAEYHDRIAAVQDDVITPLYKLVKDSREHLASISHDRHALMLVGDTSIAEVPFIYTYDGMKLKDTLTFYGIHIDEFAYSLQDHRFEGVNASDGVRIEKNIPSSMVELFLLGYSWYFDPADGMMSAKFRTQWNGIKNGNQTLQYAYLGKTLAGKQGVFLESIWPGYNPFNVTLDCEFTPVEGTDDRIILYHNYQWSGSASLFNYGNLDKLYKAIFNAEVDDPGIEYAIVADDPADPFYLTFTRVDDPDIWFKLTFREIRTGDYFTSL